MWRLRWLNLPRLLDVLHHLRLLGLSLFLGQALQRLEGSGNGQRLVRNVLLFVQLQFLVVAHLGRHRGWRCSRQQAGKACESGFQLSNEEIGSEGLVRRASSSSYSFDSLSISPCNFSAFCLASSTASAAFWAASSSSEILACDLAIAALRFCRAEKAAWTATSGVLAWRLASLSASQACSIFACMAARSSESLKCSFSLSPSFARLYSGGADGFCVGRAPRLRLRRGTWAAAAGEL